MSAAVPADGAASPSSLDRTLSALADPCRRRVVELLADGPKPAGELARLVGLRPAAMSRHLKTLRASGLVVQTNPEFDARVRIYELKSEPMQELKAWLARSEAMWSEQLLAFKRHVEGGEASGR